jgi:hypothetical protein
VPPLVSQKKKLPTPSEQVQHHHVASSSSSKRQRSVDPQSLHHQWYHPQHDYTSYHPQHPNAEYDYKYHTHAHIKAIEKEVELLKREKQQQHATSLSIVQKGPASFIEEDYKKTIKKHVNELISQQQKHANELISQQQHHAAELTGKWNRCNRKLEYKYSILKKELKKELAGE